MKTITLQNNDEPDTPEIIAWKIEQLRKLKGTCKLLTPEERKRAEEELKHISQYDLIKLYGLEDCIEIKNDDDYKQLHQKIIID
ncbi:hypothetical protein HYY69_01445 [Candidatus Woesearchaeota archaeon]|nr:hypothetical protein [Candidatus Woesearchaeota archaeon]